MNKVEALSVTQLTRRIRNLLEIEIGEIWVEGEVSNLRKQSSGHWYFSLKDQSAQISCAMFSAKRRQGAEVIEDGAKVQIFGETSFYEARGSTQLIVRKAQAVGVGDLQARFEELKRKLDKEGLFSAERKRKLPFFPKVIGIVTSPTGAALQDMQNVLSRRAPWLTVVVFPTAVQGKGAERGIARAIERAGNTEEEGLPQPEVLIVARGGGSLEDLWNFNEEVVARAIEASPIPVISGVGHEIDFTIADFVADLRAPTPSAAAELVAPDRGELVKKLADQKVRVDRLVDDRLQRSGEKLAYLERGPLGQSADRLLREPMFQLDEATNQFERAVDDSLRLREARLAEFEANWKYFHPLEMLRVREERLGRASGEFLRVMEEAFRSREDQIARFASLVKAYGPGKTLERGFSITFSESGKIVHDPSDVSAGERIDTMVHGGSISSKVEK
ncbi:exodeoxyribonuclease VII large subunit [Akkermansiaceae bacterium]|nr:exodeoxyribonuclease VII large subunit [Akkermansiaceae bacterium]MDB4377680.1 exodeoxyribonuclease VII large subunit [Akkermansiaceae bacterium]